MIEGIEKITKWSTRKFPAGKLLTVSEIYEENGDAFAAVNWYSTDFDYDGSYKVHFNGGAVEAELLFEMQEVEKLRIRVRSMKRISFEEIEDVLSTPIEDLKYKHRGSLKGKKFGL